MHSLGTQELLAMAAAEKRRRRTLYPVILAVLLGIFIWNSYAVVNNFAFGKGYGFVFLGIATNLVILGGFPVVCVWFSKAWDLPGAGKKLPYAAVGVCLLAVAFLGICWAWKSGRETAACELVTEILQNRGEISEKCLAARLSGFPADSRWRGSADLGHGKIFPIEVSFSGDSMFVRLLDFSRGNLGGAP